MAIYFEKNKKQPDRWSKPADPTATFALFGIVAIALLSLVLFGGRSTYTPIPPAATQPVAPLKW